MRTVAPDGGRILVVPDAPEAAESAEACATILEGEGHLVESSAGLAEACESLARGDYEVLVAAASDADIVRGRIHDLVAAPLDPVPILVVGRTARPVARDLVLAGAHAVVAEAGRCEDLAVATSRALRFSRGLRREARFDPAQPVLSRQIGAGESMDKVHANAARAARSTSPVLLLGEIGSGKGLVAQSIHTRSTGRRRQGPFIIWPLDAEMHEGPQRAHEELFGTVDMPGALELADGGTLFLDEITLLPDALQSALLPVVASSGRLDLERADGSGQVAADVRIMAGTSRELKPAVDQGLLRRDLYFKLRVLPIRLPPLRDRPDDLPVIADALLDRYAIRHDKAIVGLTPAAVSLLQLYDWPGNIRELQEHVHRAVRRARGPALTQGDFAELAHRLAGKVTGTHTGTVDVTLALDARLPLAEIGRRAAAAGEIAAIRRALAATGGNITHAARRLRVSRLHLQKRMRLYGLRKPR